MRPLRPLSSDMAIGSNVSESYVEDAISTEQEEELIRKSIQRKAKRESMFGDSGRACEIIPRLKPYISWTSTALLSFSAELFCF